MRATSVWLLLGGLVTLGLGQAAWGHASLVKSSPSNGATLSQSPSVIRAWFSEELAVQGSVMRLYDSQQKLLATGGIDTGVSDHTVLKITPTKLRAWNYAVAWPAVSAEDKAVRQGSFRFSVSTSGQAPPPMSTQTPDVPPPAIVSPTDHASVTNPLTVVIETTGDITTLTMANSMAMSGMGPNVHLHVLADSSSLMPTAAQLANVGPNPVRVHTGPARGWVPHDQGVLGRQQDPCRRRPRAHRDVQDRRVALAGPGGGGRRAAA